MTAANDRNGFDLFHFFLYFFFSSLPAFSSNPVPPPSSARLCRCWEQSALHLWVAWWSPHRLLIELRLNCVSWTCFHGVLPWPHSERIVSGPVWFTSLCWSDVSVWSCWFSLQVFTSWHADNNIIFLFFLTYFIFCLFLNFIFEVKAEYFTYYQLDFGL